MPEYIEREALLEEARKHAKAFSSVLIYEAIKQAPTADVVKVVRCKNCEYLKFSDCYGECSKGYMGIVSPNDYCSRGKIRVIK